MLSLIKKSLIWIVSGTASVILTACYGPQCTDAYDVSKKLTLVDPQGNPIPGLKIADWTDSPDGVFTDENGLATVAIYGVCRSTEGRTFYVFDVDGEANGGYFTTKEIHLDANKTPETITMTPGEMSDDDIIDTPD